METENWRIIYSLEYNPKIHLIVNETLKCPEGYYERLERHWEEKTPVRRDPIFRVDGNNIELFLLKSAIELPFDYTLRESTLLKGEKNPIKLVAPDGRLFKHVAL